MKRSVSALIVGTLSTVLATKILDEYQKSIPSPKTTRALETLVLCGSSTMGRRLVPNLATRFLTGHSRAQENEPISGQQWCQTNDKQDRRICVHYSGSGSGKEESYCNIIMHSSSWEQKEGYTATKVASDAVMLVTRQNDMFQSTSLPILSDIYAGRTEIKGLTILKRDEKERSGTSEAFRQLLLDVPVLEADYAISASSPHLILNRTDRWLYYISAQEQLIADNIQVVQLREHNDDHHGYLPSLQTVGSGRYPLIRPLYLVTRNNNAPQMAKDFIRYAISTKARPVFEALHMRHVTSDNEGHGPIQGPCDKHDVLSIPANLGSRINAIYYAPQGTSMPSVWTYSLRSSIDHARRQKEDLLIVGYASTDGAPSSNNRISQLRAIATTNIARSLRDEMILKH